MENIKKIDKKILGLIIRQLIDISSESGGKEKFIGILHKNGLYKISRNNWYPFEKFLKAMKEFNKEFGDNVTSLIMIRLGHWIFEQADENEVETGINSPEKIVQYINQYFQLSLYPDTGFSNGNGEVIWLEENQVSANEFIVGIFNIYGRYLVQPFLLGSFKHLHDKPENIKIKFLRSSQDKLKEYYIITL